MDQKRIAKNTIYLYLRMILILGISLYTSRIVLKELGIVDYGIYNVIGGMIVIFTYINNSMAQATQRFITFEIGQGDQERLSKVFSTSIIVHVIIAMIIVLLAETVGLWYVCNRAKIPADRMTAALYIYQFSIFIAVFTVITVPYNALIIAHERMKAFAMISLVEGVGKLVIALLLIVSPFDRLIFYGCLMAIQAVLMRIIYGVYSARNFPESRIRIVFEKEYIRNMGTFAGWSMLGSAAAIGSGQGLNLLLNYFFNPAVNAARGVAVTVQSVIRNFSSSFQMAINPQITKTYVAGEIDPLFNLIFRTSRLSVYLFIFFAIPVYIEIDTVLSLWLVEVPKYSPIFIRLLLLVTLIEILSSNLNVTAQATGRIKIYEIVTGFLLLLVVPLSYIALKLWQIPQIVFYIFLLQTCLAYIMRIVLVKRLVGLPIRKYLNIVVVRIAVTITCSVILPFAISRFCDESVKTMIIVCVSSVICTSSSVYFIGLDKNEREMFTTSIVKRFIK